MTPMVVTRAVDSGDIWTDDSRIVPAVRRAVLVEVAPGVYEFRESGTPAGSLVAHPDGGYELVIGDLTGTGVYAIVGDKGIVY